MAKEIQYAGFWYRAGAIAVDMAILALIPLTLLFVLKMTGFFYGNTGGDSGGLLPMLLAWSPAMILMFPTNPIVILYFGCFESSSWQGTPGKRILGLKVVDHTGDKLLFWHAIGRNFCKILSAYLLFAGFIVTAFTKRKQALHDMMTECLVIRGA